MLKRTVMTSAMALVVAFGASGNLAASALVLPVEAVNKVVGVRLDDLVNHFPALVPGLANVAANIKSRPDVFFRNGKIQVVHVVFLSKLPEVTPGQITLNLTAYVKYKEFSKFEKIVVSYNNGAKRLEEMSIATDGTVDLKDTSFNLSVGLVDRKIIFSDNANDIKFIFPVGVGGFDEGVLNEGRVSLLTPRFHNGFIDQRSVISKREKPRYFDGKPFIRLLKGNDLRTDSTAIGFHTEINDSFVRGFDSHGCMRLRVPDLMAFHDLIIDGDIEQTPITVLYKTRDLSDHPIAKRNMTYKTVLNNGTVESPFFPLDRDNLVQMTYKESGAPIDKLVDSALDNYENLFNYETQSQLREQDERRKNECQFKLNQGQIKQKNFDKCLDEGKRKDSAKDRLYRKLMGIE